ncbi:hypothetical protein GE21DRAFT_2087 [Neurospora crassa]|uniref:Uncharacterized protein n=1 Tax=Neurospora crassa (strain ATCC 24698 / 74-OR23-1A / CBS 708.71 / DSM 1257 / FGSC 987) TaxID=367110 RepID=Q7SI12_NEUCR|nr:hypothetical protein NCU00640 [Neurospora crassa OR74A]EAA36544.1 hypothetical protein NCU00640 [Neurospora crassa OR74A]KHE89826.1 hypothetical protein GE21DRAFT_2087 [Neurospora crassa]|eukprot:XP_965780.1 hypothetical protein NCU00640 [Neurospora crassa OR74A]
MPFGGVQKVSAGEGGELSYVLGATLTKAEAAHSVLFPRQFGEQYLTPVEPPTTGDSGTKMANAAGAPAADICAIGLGHMSRRGSNGRENSLSWRDRIKI